MARYVERRLGFSIEYPDNWKKSWFGPLFRGPNGGMQITFGPLRKGEADDFAGRLALARAYCRRSGFELDHVETLELPAAGTSAFAFLYETSPGQTHKKYSIVWRGFEIVVTCSLGADLTHELEMKMDECLRTFTPF